MRTIDFLYNNISRIAHWWIIALLMIANQICVACFEIRRFLLKGEKAPDGFFWGYGPGDVSRFFTNIGPEGTKLYVVTQMTLDFAFPIAYVLLLAIFLVLLFRSEQGHWTVLLPLLTGLFDLAENFSNVYLAKTFLANQPLGDFAKVASMFTVGKWLGTWACLLAIAVGLIAKIYLWGRPSSGP